MMKRRFGRIPAGTVELFQQHVLGVQEKVVTALPQHANEELRAFTLEKVLDTVFKDWHEHGSDKLSDADLNDLSSFVQVAASIAGQQLNMQGKPVYEAILQGLLDDWLYNWNVDESGSAKQD